MSVPLCFPGAAVAAAPRFAIQPMKPLPHPVEAHDCPDSAVTIAPKLLKRQRVADVAIILYFVK
jgi:hypothetical protein